MKNPFNIIENRTRDLPTFRAQCLNQLRLRVPPETILKQSKLDNIFTIILYMCVLLTLHLSIILVTNQLDAQNLVL